MLYNYHFTSFFAIDLVLIIKFGITMDQLVFFLFPFDPFVTST